MNLKHTLVVAVFALTGIAESNAAEWTAQVGSLQSTNAGADCFYFALANVSVADPALGTNNPWFAISRTQYGAKDAYAMLLAAKASDLAVHVGTSGLVCGGFAQATQVYMP